jgi:PTS system fructose-specific IIC component
MAADSLKAKAAEMGVTIKVETNGSGGAKNVLTKEEIEK